MLLGIFLADARVDAARAGALDPHGDAGKLRLEIFRRRSAKAKSIAV